MLLFPRLRLLPLTECFYQVDDVLLHVTVMSPCEVPSPPREPRYRNSELFQFVYFTSKWRSQNSSSDRSGSEVCALNIYATLSSIFIKDLCISHSHLSSLDSKYLEASLSLFTFLYGPVQSNLYRKAYG